MPDAAGAERIDHAREGIEGFRSLQHEIEGLDGGKGGRVQSARDAVVPEGSHAVPWRLLAVKLPA